MADETQQNPESTQPADDPGGAPKLGLLGRLKRKLGRTADVAETRNNYPLF